MGQWLQIKDGNFEAMDYIVLKSSSDGLFESGQNGVTSIKSTGDRKVECIRFKEKTLAYVKSEIFKKTL